MAQGLDEVVDVLEPRLQRLSSEYKSAGPFPHLVIDDLFDKAWLANLSKEFSGIDQGQWREFDGALQQKRGTSPGASLPPALQEYFDIVNSQEFVDLVGRLTGIDGLMPDLSLYGGGLHEVSKNGHFEVHVDFQRHPTTNHRNRVAVITYLNEGWKEEFGGSLELWRAKPQQKEVVINPALGRTVIMQQGPDAIHGHPVPITSSRIRRSLLAYYYTAADEADGPVDGPLDNTTIYIRNPDQSAGVRLNIFLREIIPRPIIDLARKIAAR